MNDAAPASHSPSEDETGDQARAETTIALGVDELFAFISDTERLFRLNPHLAIESWRSTPGGFHLTASNETNQCRVDTAAQVDVERAKRCITIRYQTGLKRATTLSVLPGDEGSRLIAVDYYPTIDDPADPRVAEVDRSLAPWIGAVHRHLARRRRWGRWLGWRWWNERFLARLAPRQRRIVRLIIWVSVIEFVVFLFVLVIFWLERQRG